MRVWVLRAVWVTSPVTAGAAASDAIAGWADAPRVVAAVLLWLAWGAATVALFAPRPAGLTLVRVVAPAFVGVALAAGVTGATSTVAGAGAIVATVVAAMLAADGEIGIATANGAAYGDEQRFPLRVPPALFLGPLPIARAAVVAGLTGGPLLLADGRLLWGALVLLAGAPVAVLALRALHRLSRRWLVFVPAGVVVVDPLTLADPVLFVRGHVRALRAVEPTARPAPGGLDLRLGAVIGSLELVFDEPADLMRAGRGRQPAEVVDASSLLVAVVERARALETAARRRVRVETRD